MKKLINRFFAFANISYTMFTVRSNVKDGRKSSQIKPSAIFLSLILMVLFKKHSFLKLDQFMRTDAPKRFFGRDSPRLVAVSDTTIPRSLSTYFLAPVRKYLKSVYIRASQLGKCKIDLCGRKLKAACVDGSQFGGFYGCVLQVLGEVNLLLDIEPTTGKGKELPTTRTLLQRAFQEYGAGFIDLFLLDGLYKDSKAIKLILSNESNVLTKTTETRLNIIKDANGLFTHHEKFPGVEYQKGLDVDRLCEYQVWSCGNFQLYGVKKDIKAVRFRMGCSKFGRKTFHQLAFSSLRGCQWSKKRLSQKREEGKGLHHSLRCLANSWVKVTFAMWRDKTPYDQYLRKLILPLFMRVCA